MGNSLYDKFNVAPHIEPKLRQTIKSIIRMQPPNSTAMNKKASADTPKYFTVERMAYMLLNSNIEIKHKIKNGKPSLLFLLFKMNTANGKYDYEKYYAVLDWVEAYNIVSTDFDISINNLIAMAGQLEDVHTAVEEDVTDNKTAVASTDMDNTELTTILTEEAVLKPDENDKTDCTVDAQTIDNSIKTVDENVNVDNSIDADNEASESFIEDSISEFPDVKEVRAYMSSVMKGYNVKAILPPINVFYACMMQNGINVEANDFRRCIGRRIIVEWTDWLFKRITVDHELLTSCKLLIDTGFIKSDGQVLYSIIDIVDNYPRYVKLDCSLVDIKANGLSLSDARNQSTSCVERLNAVKLSMDNIDFNNNIWKNHILNARRTRFGICQSLSYDTRMAMVISSIKNACVLEERGINVKRLVRSGSKHISVAIPLIVKNNRVTSMAIIMTLNSFNVWEISTIEAGKDLYNNIQAYNYYDMPAWLSL